LHKERFSALFAAMAVWGRDQFFPLGGGQSSKNIWPNINKRPPKPNVEEIRKISVPNIVVVRGVCVDYAGANWVSVLCRIDRSNIGPGGGYSIDL
jgi:hypothetical protein